MSSTDFHLFDSEISAVNRDTESKNLSINKTYDKNRSVDFNRVKISHQFSKRILDIVLSFVALIVLSPLLLLVAIAIKIESNGPVLFTQKRWGKNQSIIRVYKFRSMFVDQCDSSGRMQTVKNDRRITKVGALIRKTSIDELPQLFNILKGDMSIVGPRCHPIGMMAAGVQYEELVKRYHRRHVVKPGLTGLAQVRGFRGPTTDVSSAKGRIVNDLVYIKHQSIWLDIKIMIGTLIAEAKGGSGF